METTLDLSRWRETPRGVGYRRWVIVTTGVRQLTRTRFFRILLAIAWTAGICIALAGFGFSQAVATGGWLEDLAAKFGPRAEAVASAFAAFVLLYPDICVRTVFTSLFWAHSFVGLWLSLFALTALVPQLITRDRASNALTVYLARPLTSADYLLGKLGIVVGVLVLLWTGPLLCGWLLSMLVAPNRDFIVYSFEPLLRALAFHGIALVSLAAIALGVSAVGRSSRATVILWLGLWLILGSVAAPPPAPVWIKRASFTQNLDQARREVFNLDEALTAAGEQLPLFNPHMAADLARAGDAAEATDTRGALGALAAFVVLSSFVFLRRLRPE